MKFIFFVFFLFLIVISLFPFFVFLNIKNINYLPQWIILCIDMGMVFFSGILGYILLKLIGFDFVLNTHFNGIIFFYLIVAIFFFWIFHTYSSIIRHSTFNDLINILAAQSATFVFMFLLKYEYIFVLIYVCRFILYAHASYSTILLKSCFFFFRAGHP